MSSWLRRAVFAVHEGPRLAGRAGEAATPLALAPGGSWLEIGAGSGVASVWLAAAFRPASVTLTDVFPGRLGAGAARLERMGISAFTSGADAATLPFAARAFDLALAVLCLHHLSAPERALRELARVTRPGASLLVEELTEDSLRARLLARFAHEARLFPLDELVRDIESAGFAVRRVTKTFFGVAVHALRTEA